MSEVDSAVPRMSTNATPKTAAVHHQIGAGSMVRGSVGLGVGMRLSAQSNPDRPPKAAGMVERKSSLMPRGSKAPAMQ
jgi:hypothetical protein